MTPIHRALVALVSTSLAVSVAAAAPAQAAAASASSPAGRGATWSSDQLTPQGLIHNPNFGGFDDYGLTADTAFALKAVGGHTAEVRKARNALAAHVDDYISGSAATGDPGGRYAGPTAKLLVLAESTGGDPTQLRRGEPGPAPERVGDHVRTRQGTDRRQVGVRRLRQHDRSDPGRARPDRREEQPRRCCAEVPPAAAVPPGLPAAQLLQDRPRPARAAARRAPPTPTPRRTPWSSCGRPARATPGCAGR